MYINVDPCSDPWGLITSGMLLFSLKCNFPQACMGTILCTSCDKCLKFVIRNWLAVGSVICLHKPIPQWSPGIASAFTELVIFERGRKFWPLKCIFFLTHLRCSFASVLIRCSSFEKRLYLGRPLMIFEVIVHQGRALLLRP